MHDQDAEQHCGQQHGGGRDVGKGEVDLTKAPTAHGADEHGDPLGDGTTGKDRIHSGRVADRGQRVDHPRFNGASEERIAKAQQRGCQHERQEARLDHAEPGVQQRGNKEYADAHQVRGPTTDGVGNDPRGHFKDDVTGGEGGVRDHDAEYVEAGVQQEERVDDPATPELVSVVWVV